MKFIRTAALVAGLAAAPGLVLAQAPAANAPMTGVPSGQFRADQIMDRDVYSTDNVEVGEVDDLVIDPATGRVTMVVIEVENRLGLTQKHVAVPLDRLRVTPGERRVTLNMASADLRALPAFNR